jgi:RNA recognition motif-containing protein
VFVLSKRLYVGNLDYKVTDKQLKEAFEKVGKVVSAEVVVKPMGFGFVEMEDDAKAQEAINTLNGQTLGERAMKVDFAKSDMMAGGEEVSAPPAETVVAPEITGEKVAEPEPKK